MVATIVVWGILAGAAASYYLIINLITYWVFQHDKEQSIAGGWRVPESQLLGLAALGGSLGAKWAQKQLRHKTRKEPFRTMLNGIVLVQCMLLASLIFPPVRAVAAQVGRQAAVFLSSAVKGLDEKPAKLPRRFGPGS